MKLQDRIEQTQKKLMELQLAQDAAEGDAQARKALEESGAIRLDGIEFDEVGGPAAKLKVNHEKSAPHVPVLPEDCEISWWSDIHVGGVSFHDKAFQTAIDYTLEKDNRYVLLGGDYITGTHPFHPYYDHLEVPVHEYHDLSTVLGQIDAFADIIKPLVEEKRIIGAHAGNHDLRGKEVMNSVPKMCRDLEIPYLNVSALTTIYFDEREVDIYSAHEGRRLPAGAKDPRQRKGNRESALQRHLESHFESANWLAYGHTHELTVAKPLGHMDATVRNADQRFMEDIIRWDELTTPEFIEKGYKYVHPYGKWYSVGGTFERTGLTADVSSMDPRHYMKMPYAYSQQHNWTKSAIGYTRTQIKEGRIDDIHKVEYRGGKEVVS